VADIEIGICSDAASEARDKPEFHSESGLSIAVPKAGFGACPDGVIQIAVQSSGSPCPCIDWNVIQESQLSLEWKSEDEEVPDYSTPEPSDTKTETTYDDHPTISFDAVQACNWNGATVDVLIGESRETLITYTRGGSGCPENEGAGYSAQWPDNRIIPGAKLEITHFLDCPAPNQITGNYVIWESVCLTGGVVTGVIGEYTDANHSYRVQLMTDEIIEVAPDDWVDYREGDWVTIITVGSGAAQFGNKGGIIADAGDKQLIVPFGYGDNPGNGGLTWQPVEFGAGDNQSLLNLRNVAGEIIEINEDDNKALVNIPHFGQIEAQFAWHCPGSGDWEDAWKAYEIGDKVNVLLPGIAHDAHVNTPKTPPEKPLIAGWVAQQLRQCSSLLYFFVDPLEWHDADGNVVQSDDPTAETVARVFDCEEVNNSSLTTVDITDAAAIGLPFNSFCIAGNTEDTEHGDRICQYHASKTVGDYTAHALSWMVPTGSGTFFYWGVWAEHKNEKYIFKPDPNDDTTWTDLWDDDNPYPDRIVCDSEIEAGEYTPVKAFDLFELQADQDAYGWRAGDIILVSYGNKSSADLWNLTQNDHLTRAVPIYAQILTDYPSETQAEDRTVALGINRNLIYIAYAQMSGPHMYEYYDLYEFDVFEGSWERWGESGTGVVYNPFTKEIISFVVDSESESLGYTAEARDLTFNGVVSTDNRMNCDGKTSPCATHYFKSRDDAAIIYAAGYDSLTIFSPGYCPPGYSDLSECCGVTYTYWKFRMVDGEKYKRGDGSYKWVGHTNYYSTTRWTRWYNDPDCSSVNEGIIGGACNGIYYEDWLADWDDFSASIHPDGTGFRLPVTLKNGQESSQTGCDNNVIETADNYDYESLDTDYLIQNWPHMPAYAIAENVTDRDGNQYEQLIAIQNNDGDIIVDGEIISDQNGYFQFRQQKEEVEINA